MLFAENNLTQGAYRDGDGVFNVSILPMLNHSRLQRISELLNHMLRNQMIAPVAQMHLVDEYGFGFMRNSIVAVHENKSLLLRA